VRFLRSDFLVATIADFPEFVQLGFRLLATIVPAKKKYTLVSFPEACGYQV
jgi:hypothetical protein